MDANSAQLPFFFDWRTADTAKTLNEAVPPLLNRYNQMGEASNGGFRKIPPSCWHIHPYKPVVLKLFLQARLKKDVSTSGLQWNSLHIWGNAFDEHQQSSLFPLFLLHFLCRSAHGPLISDCLLSRKSLWLSVFLLMLLLSQEVVCASFDTPPFSMNAALGKKTKQRATVFVWKKSTELSLSPSGALGLWCLKCHKLVF